MDIQTNISNLTQLVVKEIPSIGNVVFGLITKDDTLKAGSFFITGKVTRFKDGFVEVIGGGTCIDGIIETDAGIYYIVVNPKLNLSDFINDDVDFYKFTQSLETVPAFSNPNNKPVFNFVVKEQPTVGKGMIGLTVNHPFHKPNTVCGTSEVLAYQHGRAETRSNIYIIKIDPNIDFKDYGYFGPMKIMTETMTEQEQLLESKKDFLSDFADLLEMYGVTMQGQTSGRFITIFHGDDLLFANDEINFQNVRIELDKLENKN